MSTLHFHRDYETRSWVDLKKTGAHKYMQHPTTSVWCASYAMGDGPVKLWTPGQPIPAEFVEAQVDEDVECWAHNCAFEQCVETYVGPRYRLPKFKMTQQRCTMVGAYAMALPGALEDLAPALGMDVLKDAAGKRLMLQMSRPRKVEYQSSFTTIPYTAVRVQEMDADGWEVYATTSGRIIARVQWWNEPEKVERLGAYCLQDTEVERAVGKRIRPLKDSELALWHLDQQINFRGVFVDEGLCLAAKEIVAKVEEDYDRRMLDLTGKAVTACSNRNQLVTWLRGQGLDDIESVAKDQIDEILGRKDLKPIVREVLELRRASAKASVAKIDALLNGMDLNGDAMGLLQFHAASTGRWAGRRFQPQNIKRPTLDLHGITQAIPIIRTGDYDLMTMVYDEPLDVVGDCIRGMVQARPGHRIVAADYSNIEGRTLAWLAGEEWKLQAFRDYDNGTGHDLYKITAGGILGKKPEDITKAERQAYGKVPELACGFQGGLGAFQTMAVNYNVDLPDDQVREIVKGWRDNHPRTKQFWYDLDDAALRAVDEPGTIHCAGPKILFKMAGSFLFMRLPSGRLLSYAYPRVVWKEMPWLNEETGKPAKKRVVAHMGMNSYTRRWELCYPYGGLFAENAASGTARDVMAHAMPRLEAAGYPIILTVHDEIVTEPKISHGSLEEMCALMVPDAEWAAGLPVSVAGFEAERYGKGE